MFAAAGDGQGFSSGCTLEKDIKLRDLGMTSVVGEIMDGFCRDSEG